MALIKCRECGKEISDETKKCIHCGADVILTIKCSECGKTFDHTTNICPYCGKKNAKDLNISVLDAKKNFTKKIKEHKKKVVMISAIALLLIIGIIAFLKIVPPLFVSVEEHLARAEYEKAYEKAKKEEKDMVLLENLIAQISYEISDGLKDPSSFQLSHVYYDGEDELVFEIIGKNSYGGNVTNYYDYRYDEEKNKYTSYCYLSSLEAEKTYSFDSYTERLDKILHNIVRKTVQGILSDPSKKLDDKMVDRINTLFKEKKLRDINLLPQVPSIYPSSKNSNA